MKMWPTHTVEASRLLDEVSFANVMGIQSGGKYRMYQFNDKKALDTLLPLLDLNEHLMLP